SSRRRHTRSKRDWSSDVCSSDLAQGWDEHVGESRLAAFREAEKAALHAIEQADRGGAWDEVRRTLFGLTESGAALISWRAEHGEIGRASCRERVEIGVVVGAV